MSKQLPETFEPENQDGNTWDLLPAGEYLAQIVEADVLQPRSLDGYFLALTWRVLDGEFEGRQVWQRVTYAHSSEQAQTTGRKTVKDLCTALGISEYVEGVEVFLFKPARIKVGVEKDKAGVYEDKNKVTRVLPLEPSAQPATAKPAAAPAPQATAKPRPVAKGPARPAPSGSAPWHQQG